MDNELDDSRLEQLLDLLRHREGFCNYAIMADEPTEEEITQ